MTVFLRRSRDTIERAWCSDKPTAREKAAAMFVLRGLVKIARHPYDRDPASGAGNCWCGRDPASRIHDIVLGE